MRTEEPEPKITLQTAPPSPERPAEPDIDTSPAGPGWTGGLFSRPNLNFGLGLVLTAILGGVAMLVAPLPGLVVLGNLTIAMIIGIVWRVVFGLPKPYRTGVQFSAKKLLRLGIILTGVRLNFSLIASSGLQVLLLDIVLITFGLFFIRWLAQKFGVKPGLALLISVGQSICGASAVGAIAPLSKEVDEDDVSLAVALCGVLGTVGVLFFSLGAAIFGWQGRFYGLVTGSTLHEIAQVVAAGPAGGPLATDLALVVKLTRVMLLAPVAIILAFVLARRESGANGEGKPAISWRKLPIPWFVLGFVLVGVLNSTGWLPKDLTNFVLQVSIFFMVMAMSAMGLNVDLVVIRQRGLRALGASALGFGTFIGLSSLIIFTFGIA